MNIVMFLIKTASSLLSLMIEHLVELMLSSMMVMVMVKGAWSDVRHQLECIE